MRALLTALVIAILFTQDFIDLEGSVDLGRWHLNAPAADLLAVAVIPLALWALRALRVPLPGPAGYGVFLIASAMSVHVALDPHAALHHLLRKPIFLYVAYGFGLAGVIGTIVSERALGWGLLTYAAGTSALSLVTSALRITSGDTLWFARIDGITPNHKTLAVALAAWVPLLLSTLVTATPRMRILARATLGVSVLSILASTSKTAWITAAFGLAWSWPQTARWARRPTVAIPVVLGALALAIYAPILMGSAVMLNAARSRHSLDLRAWQMFRDHPMFGSGTGMNVVVEMVTFPHYRINGVDAHGFIQKIASETGVVGLLGYGLFVGAMAGVLRAHARAETTLGPALFATFLALHLNLLLSTETFSPTHWVPLAVVWGLAHRQRQPALETLA